MLILAWNCRGIGTSRTVGELRDLIKSTSPQIVGLVETKSNVEKMEKLRVKIGFLGCFVVPSCRGSGGLAVFWRRGTDVSIRSYSNYHIDFLVHVNTPVRFTLFYGSPLSLRKLSVGNQWPWCVFGDFNEVLKSSGNFQRQNQIEKFKEVVADCSLLDLGYSEYKFTLSNKRRGRDEAKGRLDRALINRSLRGLFPEATTQHVHTYSSDHAAIWINLPSKQNDRSATFRFKKKSIRINLPSKQKNDVSATFRFEKMWLRDDRFLSIVRDTWISSSNQGLRFEKRLEILSKKLEEWNKKNFGNVGATLKQLKSDLAKTQTSSRTDVMIEREQRIIEDIDEWLIREEILWRQRSRICWLKEGDSNSKFFHAYANGRRKTNYVVKLQREDGTFTYNSEEMKVIFYNYYKKIYGSASQISQRELTTRLQCVPQKVTGQHNYILTSPYTVDEVTRAVFQLHPDKAPGKDGFTTSFIQSCWEIIKDNFISECLLFLNGGQLHDDTNITLITLISKQKRADKVHLFRPISLTGVKAKVISKVIANRLQDILGEVISMEQCAFVKDRLISDTILLAQEINHFIRTNSQQHVYGSLKLDITKAYDTVDWLFLRGILNKLGFAEDWVNMIMRIVTSVTYSIKVNGSYTASLVPQRGLRQGDPLSPYLYILCTEWFSARIREYNMYGLVDGIKICRRAPYVSHLLFADDSLLYLKVTQNSIQKLRELLDEYECISGQGVNFSKSEIMTSRNLSDSLRNFIINCLGVNVVEYHTIYLGLPLQLSRRRSETFNGIFDKIHSKMQSWKSVTLSIGGRQVLIDAVLNAIPQYWLSSFLLPEEVIDKLHSNITEFWWQKAGGSRSVHWIKADKLRQSKEEGGLGFLNFKWLNLAYLAHQGWRIIKHPELLGSKVLKAKYFSNCHLLDSRIGYRPSHIWQGIHRALPILRYGIILDNITGELKWKENNSGNFDIKSAYKVARQIELADCPNYAEQSDNRHLKKFWKQVWKLPIPRKIKIFVWRAYHRGLPTGLQLCHICHYRWEDEKHIFTECWWSQNLWRLMHMDIIEKCINFGSIADFVYYIYTSASAYKLCMVIITLWYIWYNRNLVAHGKDCISPEMAARQIKMLYNEYCSNNADILKCLDTVTLHWQRPKGTYVKANCDASWDPNTASGGIGVLIRDNAGTVVGISAKYIPQCTDAYFCEGLALQEAFNLATKLKLKNVVFETDSKEVVMAINYKVDQNVWNASWFLECCRILELKKNWKLFFTRREANMAADALAKHARRFSWSWSKLDALPLV
ncbi:hypothetical protein QQ045_002525 [Rhodiola kirilowii]